MPRAVRMGLKALSNTDLSAPTKGEQGPSVRPIEQNPFVRGLAKQPILAFLVVMACAAGASAEESPVGEDDALTLQQALTLAASSSPELQVSAWEIRAADAQLANAGQGPNPELAIELEDFLGSGALARFNGAQTTLLLSQTLELGNKRRARAAVAQGALGVVESDDAAQRLAVLTETTIRFVHVVADQQRLIVAREASALAEAALAAASRRVAAGAASPIEERRASILRATARIEVEHAEHELLASRRQLVASWGESEPRFTAAKAELFGRRPLPSYETFAARIDSNPELVKVAQSRAARDAELALARAQALPDLRVQAGARRLEGPDAFGIVFGIALPLPIFQRNQGAILAAGAKRAQVDATHDAVRVRILASLYAQYQELVHAMTELESIESHVLPNAESLLELLNAGFAIGRFSQLELLDGQRTLMEARRDRIAAAEEMHTLAVRVEALLGATVEPPAREHDDGDVSQQDGGRGD